MRGRRSERTSRKAPTNRNFGEVSLLVHDLQNALAPINYSLFVLDQLQPMSDQALQSRITIGRQLDEVARLVERLGNACRG